MVVVLENPVSGQVFGITSQQAGSIAVSSVPYQTTISLDNRQAGVTPVVLNGISPGAHTVLLTTPGYLPYTQQVTVNAGSVTRVYAVLIQKPRVIPSAGSIRISSSPTAATIYIDSRLMGVTPMTIGGISAGQHQVLLTKQEYGNYYAQVTVSGGAVTDVYAILDKQPSAATPSGTISVVSTPSFASVYLDNRLTGVTPETINRVAPGQHELRILKPGYTGVTRSVTVVDNQIAAVTVVLPVNPSIYL